jgi:hypothetical protein
MMELDTTDLEVSDMRLDLLGADFGREREGPTLGSLAGLTGTFDDLGLSRERPKSGRFLLASPPKRWWPEAAAAPGFVETTSIFPAAATHMTFDAFLATVSHGAPGRRGYEAAHGS